MNTFEQVRSLAEALSLPAAHLECADRERFSRIGGVPLVPPAFVWPEWKNEPLSFLAQVDIADIVSPVVPAWMPIKGQLYFFYDKEQSTWGFDPADRGSWRVIYSNEDSANLVEAAVPSGIEQHIYNRVPVEFSEIGSRPDSQRFDFNYSDISDEESEALDEWKSPAFGDTPYHQMFGYPIPIQGDQMELECQLASSGVNCGTPEEYESPRAAKLSKGAKDWHLLLQLDSDDDAGMMWGDAGRLYFWIRETEARKADFTNAWMVLQCG